MVDVRRLVTTVDLVDAYPQSPHHGSVSALHEAELSDGRRVVLLDDRGWTWQLHSAGARGTEAEPPAEVPGVWLYTTASDLEDDARTVVGPDEASDESTDAQMEAGHWKTLAAVLAGHGLQIEPERLAALPHDVELTDRVLARIGRRPRAEL